MNEGNGLNEQGEQKVTVRNVACVDLRTASEETLANIDRIENVAAVLYSPQNAKSITRLTLLNVASVLEAPADAHLITGQEVLGKRFFEELEEPLSMVVAGQIMLAADVEADDLRAGIDSLIVMGQILYPDHLGGVIQSKLDHVSGQAMAYSGSARLTVGRLNLTQSTLEALDDDSALTVVGAVSARTVLPNELIERKVRELQIIGALTCREENAGILLNRVRDSIGGVHTTVIPAGFEPVAGAVTLDAGLLDALPARKLYCRDLRIADDVDAEQLDSALDALKISNLLIAPATLRTVLAHKCNLLETDAVLYSGALWQFDDEHTLHPQRFDFAVGNVTMVVTGELTIAPDVEPAVLAQRVEKVHNFGEIFCTAAQMSALEDRAGLGRGEFIDNGVEDVSGNVIGNTAYVKL